MKKILCVTLALIMMLTTAACGAAQTSGSPVGSAQTLELPADEPQSSQKPAQVSGDIQMTVKEQNVAGDVESVSLNIKNASDKEYSYGAMFTIEAEKNGGWEEVDPIADLMWIEIAYIIKPGETNENTITIKEHYGTLASGNYRIVKAFTSTDGNNLTAYGTFTVK